MSQKRPGPYKVMKRRAAGEITVPCRRCSTVFPALHANSKYCSPKCKTANWTEVRRIKRVNEPRIELLPKTEQWIARRERLIQEQNNKCALCFITLTQTTTVLDHDHVTGKIRAVLCRRCNIGLGYFSDDIMKLQAALDYVKLHRKKKA
jgi:Pyruvate/2-oxoacid:ferredoxin oxidoreductase delta subunit